MTVTLTGTMGGPPEFNGLAGPGTLVRYGDDANNCSAVKMQFDAGRGTLMRLSQLNIPAAQLNAVFFTLWVPKTLSMTPQHGGLLWLVLEKVSFQYLSLR